MLLKKITNRISIILVLLSLFFVEVPTFSFEKDTVLILSSGNTLFNDTINSIADDLRNDFIIDKLIITKKTGLNILKHKIDSKPPNALILLDNGSILFLKKFQKIFHTDKYIIPSVSILAINVEYFIKDLKKSIGIAYEVPIVTSLINLRMLFKNKICKRTCKMTQKRTIKLTPF